MTEMKRPPFIVGSLNSFILLSAILVTCRAEKAAAGIVVGNSDFVSDVYELRYYTRSQQLFKNGVGTSLSSSAFISQYFMQNTGDPGSSAWMPGDSFNPGGTRPYLMASNSFNGFYGGAVSVHNTSAFGTMGWDFSGVSGQVQKVELISRNAIFQFAQWIDEAYGDKIYGSVATPTSFGNGAFTEVYSHTGNATNTSFPSALITEGVIDLTPSLSANWLNDPKLLEVKFGYDLVDRDIPGRHIQLFRDDTGTYGDPQSFMLRVTLASSTSGTVPEPASMAIFVFLGLTACGCRHRRRKPRSSQCPSS
jgi:hypothetical protein